MKEEDIIHVKSLKELVYDYLREQITKHKLEPGATINMDATSRKLGISKTPLRDALLQLEMEGFVTIKARKGIYVNYLTLQDIKNFYQVIGALESSALMTAFDKMRAADIKRMRKLNEEMKTTITKDNFDLFYRKNLEFHNHYIQRSQNAQLINIIDTLKKRLYDFPQQNKWIKEWEESSLLEHAAIVDAIDAGDRQEASRLIHDVHWSFDVQEKYIMLYYFPEQAEAALISE